MRKWKDSVDIILWISIWTLIVAQSDVGAKIKFHLSVPRQIFLFRMLWLRYLSREEEETFVVSTALLRDFINIHNSYSINNVEIAICIRSIAYFHSIRSVDRFLRLL